MSMHHTNDHRCNTPIICIRFSPIKNINVLIITSFFSKKSESLLFRIQKKVVWFVCQALLLLSPSVCVRMYVCVLVWRKLRKACGRYERSLHKNLLSRKITSHAITQAHTLTGGRTQTRSQVHVQIKLFSYPHTFLKGIPLLSFSTLWIQKQTVCVHVFLWCLISFV